MAGRDLDNDRGSRADEYEAYLSRGHGKIKGSALDWWLRDEQRKAWPRLSQMAIDILSIPAMSDEPERVFSGARRTISWSRAKLGSTAIEQTQCLKSWMRSGLAYGYDQDQDSDSASDTQ